MKSRNKLYIGAMAAMLGCAMLLTSVNASTPLTVQNYAIASAASKTAALDLSIPQSFQITRPTKQLTTTLSSYFITGTSDPSRPVYFNGTEIQRQGTKGTFGVLADLALGTNTFRFQQGDKQETVTIVRNSPSTGVARISDITQNSMFPSVQGGAKVGESLQLSCVAPAGATVHASFGGKTIQLSQVAAAQAGVPATFRGSMTVEGNYNPSEIKKVGPVTYSMSYNGTNKNYQSSGDLYVAGQNTYIAIRVNSYLGYLYPDTSNLSVFKEYIKRGGVEFVKNQTNGYFELYCGGWVPTAQVEIMEGTLKVSNILTEASLRTGSKSETITFSGDNKPFFDAVLGQETFSFTMYNSHNTPALSLANSNLFSAVSVKNEYNATTYTLTFKNRGKYWGYNVTYDENGNTMLELRYKPTLSQTPGKPLEGLTLLVDPGHGGSDPGALGVAGTTGPTEKTMNLANAYALRDRLVSQGATVYLTRDDDATYSALDTRLEAIERVNADLFISLHHNSIGESTNANTVHGMEIYYHNGTSQNFANSLMKSLAANTGRRERFVRQSYYRVTLLPQSPAVLVELGYMSNPAEYESLTSQNQINAAADSIIAGIKNALA